MVDLGGAEVARVGADVLGGVETDMSEGDVDQLAHAVRLAGRDHEVVGLVLLQHHPHRLDVVLRVSPVALGVEVAEQQLVLEAELDRGGPVRDLAGYELQAPTR